MSVIHVCDYCGRNITDGAYLEVTKRGWQPDHRGELRHVIGESFGHYHSRPPAHGEPSCWRRIVDAIELTESLGPTLETIETATGQAIAAKRRKHRKPDESGAL